MDEQLARIIAVAAMRSSNELANLVPLLTSRSSGIASDDLKRGIARALGEIGTEVLRPVFREFPALEREFEANVAKYGRTS